MNLKDRIEFHPYKILYRPNIVTINIVSELEYEFENYIKQAVIYFIMKCSSLQPVICHLFIYGVSNIVSILIYQVLLEHSFKQH